MTTSAKNRRLREAFLEKGYKVTKHRLEILRCIESEGRHCSAQKIYKFLKNQSGIGRATVFRTLKLLKALGFIKKLQLSEAQSVFESRTATLHHDHIVCVRCGRIVEFSNPAIERLQLREAEKHGFSVTGHTLEIRGYCKKCA